MRMPIQTAGVPRTVSQAPVNPNVQPQFLNFSPYLAALYPEAAILQMLSNK